MERFEQQDLWTSGEGGYVRYRIPALLTTAEGTIIAFCEARKHTGADSDQIDLFLRRSVDGGATFGPSQVIATEEDWVCGNPAPVQDRATGRIHLLFCKNRKDGDETAICEGKAHRTVWRTWSDDDGLTFSEPSEITTFVKMPHWSWYATGPCHGIQTADGRLLIACDHIAMVQKRRHVDPYHSHVVYSDDGGESWHIGGIADEGTNESVVVEAEDGRICLNSRNKYALSDGGNYRGVSWSHNSGGAFSPLVHDAALPEPICQASMVRLSSERETGKSRVLFSNPANRTARIGMTVRLSYDDCRTWPVCRLIHGGPSAYSDLCIAADGSIRLLYERGEDGPYERLTLARFNLEWLSVGADSMRPQRPGRESSA